jgi:myo-inositol-1(or 4)-monophosphatase
MTRSTIDHIAFLSEALNAASRVARKRHGVVTGVAKREDSNQVLTETDHEIGSMLIERIVRAYPDATIIDEEVGLIDRSSRFTWVVDPIDGTSNFAEGLPHYGIMLGLLEEDVPIAGGIALPYFEKLYVAQRGSGTHCNGDRVTLSQVQSLNDVLLAYGIDGHRDDPESTYAEIEVLAKLVLACRNLRSSNSVYDFAMVLEGRYGAWLNRTSKLWDNVAQHILLEEAGGVYTDFWGSPMDYSRPTERLPDNFTVCAAHAKVHDAIQMVIHAS